MPYRKHRRRRSWGDQPGLVGPPAADLRKKKSRHVPIGNPCLMAKDDGPKNNKEKRKTKKEEKTQTKQNNQKKHRRAKGAE